MKIDAKKKEREVKEKKKIDVNKERSMKEVHINVAIATNDMEIKINKIKEFLGDFHPVKISILMKKVRKKEPNPTLINGMVRFISFLLPILEF